MHSPFDQADIDGLRSPPPAARSLMVELKASPRLVAHLLLVADVADRLLAVATELWPSLAVDAEAVRFGAATHDLGKALVPQELSAPGKTHEELGRTALLHRGVSASKARFAVTHGLPPDHPDLTLEDLFVMSADKIWKGMRVEALEERLAKHIADTLRIDLWDVLPGLLDALEEIAKTADRRLIWQNQFAVL